jgi:hypothetical protein
VCEMKIAVLLRGQMRYSKEGAHLFQKFVIDKFPQHEFRFFVSAPKRINYMSDEPIAPRHTTAVNLTIDELAREINHWPSVSRWNDQSEYVIFNAVKKIILELASDKKLYAWWEEYTKKHNIKGADIDNIMPNLSDCIGDTVDFKYHLTDIIYNTINARTKILTQDNTLVELRSLLENINSGGYQYYNMELCRHAFELHNLLSQYYSFARSVRSLKDYMKDYPDYMPDLVWSTRPDVVHIFESKHDYDKLDSIYKYINLLSTAKEYVDKVIIASHVSIMQSHPFLHDFNFFSTVKNLDNILKLDYQSCEDILINAMTKNKHNLFQLREGIYSQSHISWGLIFNNACILQQHNVDDHFSYVIRHSYDLQAIHNMTGSNDDITLLKQMEENFTWPVFNTAPSDEFIINEFEYLSKH